MGDSLMFFNLPWFVSATMVLNVITVFINIKVNYNHKQKFSRHFYYQNFANFIPRTNGSDVITHITIPELAF